MFNFHKPRVYRSTDGCCICRAKSSSSRFTASRKYEKESMQCFNLHEPRNGEICNACVLLVKRYKRLPVGSKRHWGHVVDARAGPGTKSLAKQKKRENECEVKSGGSFIPEKFAKIFKKNRKGKITAATAPSAANQQQQQRNGNSSPHSEEQPSDSNESYDEHEQQLQQQQQQLIGSTAATPYQTRKRTAAAAQLATESVLKKSAAQRSRYTGSKRRRMLEPKKNRRAVDNVPFFEEHDLLRLDVCCGTVFQSLSLGSACYIIDTELYKPCEKHRRRRQQPEQQRELEPVAPTVQQTELEPKPVSQSISTPALKKHHLYFKRQSESFPQGEVHRISPIPLNKTEPATITVQQQQQHSTAIATVTSAALHSNILTTAVGAASPSSLSSSSNCSTSSSVATKFSDNSSDSGFDEHVLERKSVSPPTQDEQQLDKKPRSSTSSSVQRLILASGLPISGQAQNLVLTGNEFTARFVQRQQAPKINVLTAAAAGGAATAAGATITSTTTPTITGSQSNGNKMRAIFNNANTIQHENGVTTILPASSLAATNQTAAMNAIAPSTVTITPAKKPNATAAAAAAAAVVNPKFILLKPAIGKFGSNNNQVNPPAAEIKIT
ncbi:uncharacterized protein LOC6585447 isoform X1 [Drosophila mojavensis]|uniref:Uncharacterized protein, isoform A n=1 Tax=Drosophila mojavensis TaxID=7230 RepID=B4L6C4_DROMO|nr:uncharacterized protein LOC6585447 isoform X1 [Drosophila mojavensis]XP_015016395.1 uncharacterized protein LOC6585447 isoform X1 [Drosophila mojavensis]EDW05920.1 uncharacterized protein Dmoj_GI16341, isoform A [Drosophila mojavensis]KRG07086.1 uncharacterized protein Dmoj_GI16341, isoform B [Drosophila mojavensis]